MEKFYILTSGRFMSIIIELSFEISTSCMERILKKHEFLSFYIWIRNHMNQYLEITIQVKNSLTLYHAFSS